jgi:hypothetical protein
VCADRRNAFGPPDAGNPHVRWDEGGGASSTLLLYSTEIFLKIDRSSQSSRGVCFRFTLFCSIFSATVLTADIPLFSGVQTGNNVCAHRLCVWPRTRTETGGRPEVALFVGAENHAAAEHRATVHNLRLNASRNRSGRLASLGNVNSRPRCSSCSLGNKKEGPMGRVIVLVGICGWLASNGVFGADGSDVTSSRAGSGRSPVFNVLDYEAVGDDKTDNTEAFSACLKAVIEAGGGRMFLPDGVYRGKIIIPGTKKWITVEIVGETEPTPVFGTIGSFPLQKNGTIVKSLSKSGPAVISASNSPEKLYLGFSGVNVILRNLDIRTYDDPGIGGIDLKNAAQCKIENVHINTDTYNVQASKPTHGTSGLVTPACNNAAWTVLRNVVVTGYHTGIVVNEHTDGDNIVVASNINGLEFLQAHHASRFARVGTYRNTYHVTISGRHGFSISQMNTEQPGKGQTNDRTAWQTLISDIHDPRNLGIADINYWVVVGGVGAVDQFVINGGGSIRARRIGSTSGSNESTRE